MIHSSDTLQGSSPSSSSSSGWANGLRASGYTAHTAASPAAMWSGWLAKMKSQLRSGDCVSTRSGLT